MTRDLHDIREEAIGRVGDCLAAHAEAPAAAAALQPILDEYNGERLATVPYLAVTAVGDKVLRFEELASGDGDDLVFTEAGYWWCPGEDPPEDPASANEQAAWSVLRLVPWGSEEDAAMMIAWMEGAKLRAEQEADEPGGQTTG